MGTPVFQSIKEYDDRDNLISLQNYNWDGPLGFLLTEEQHYTYDEKSRLAIVEEPNSRESWTFTYDSQDNWITMTYRDELNDPGNPLTWHRDITYYP